MHRTASQDAYPMIWYPILNISEHRLCNFHEVSDVNLASMANVATEFFGMRRIQASLSETGLRVSVSFCNWSSLIFFDIPMHVVSYTIHPWHPSSMSARQKRGVQSPTYQIFLLSVYHKFDAIVHLIKLPVRDHNLLQSDSVSQSPFGAKHIPDATNRNFQNFVFARVKASHFTVNPYQRPSIEVQRLLHSCMQCAARDCRAGRKNRSVDLQTRKPRLLV